MKKRIALLCALMISGFLFGEIPGWELVGFEPPASPDGHTIITLEQISNNKGELELNADIAATLVPDGQTTTFILRLLFQDHTEEIPMVIQGGIGFLASPRSKPILRNLWPNQSIQVVDEKQLMQAFIKPTFHAEGINKGPREPRSTFNGTTQFIFEKDLEILTTDSKWKKLKKTQIRSGIRVMNQSDMPQKSWGCGPNTAARALHMMHHPIGNLNRFVEECPKSWPFIWPIGPTPTMLANYIEPILSKYTTQANLGDHFWNILQNIKESVEVNIPTIILIIRSFADMHYVNVIGYNDREQRIAIMNTDKTIYWMTYSELKHWMTAEGHILKLFSLRDYNTVRFIRRSGR